jgi:hypothetical protein
MEAISRIADRSCVAAIIRRRRHRDSLSADRDGAASRAFNCGGFR